MRLHPIVYLTYLQALSGTSPPQIVQGGSHYERGVWGNVKSITGVLR